MTFSSPLDSQGVSPQRLYFDHNATSPMPEIVRNDVSNWLCKASNASSIHAQGRHAKGVIEHARTMLQESINASDTEVTFMSGGTEANTTVFATLVGELNISHCIVGTIEHLSILQAAQIPSVEVSLLPCNEQGVYDLQCLSDKMASIKGRVLVSLMYANNETGVIQDIKEVANITHNYKGVLHTDASQALGKIPIDFEAIDCDMMTVCGHKMGALIGIGALIVRKNLPFKALIVGGGHEQGRRAGTENTIAIVSWLSVLKAYPKDSLFAHTLSLRKIFEEKLLKHFSMARIVAYEQNRLPNTILCVFHGFDAMQLLIMLDMKGVSVSIGAACSSGSIKKSHVLEAMGYDKKTINSTLRISIGPEHNTDDIDEFIHILQNIIFKKHHLHIV